MKSRACGAAFAAVLVCNLSLDLARAQTAPPVSPSANSANSVPLVTLPFTLKYGHIIVRLPMTKAGAGGSIPKDAAPFRLVLDTGADFSLLASEAIEAKKITIPSKASDIKTQIEGVGNDGKTSARLVHGIAFDTKGLVVHTNTLLFPFDRVYEYGVDGVLGAELFRAYVIEIDYVGLRVRFFDPKTYTAPAKNSGFVRVPISFVSDKQRAIVPVEVTLHGFAAATAHLQLDTGDFGTVSFAAPFVKKNGWEFATQSVRGGGMGISGFSNARKGRLRFLTLGGIRFATPLADFSFDTSGMMAGDESDGLLGGGLLSRFTAIIDYPHAALYLKPNKNAQNPFPYRDYGWFFDYAPNSLGGWLITDVDADGPADKAGIKADDFLYAVDHKPIAGFSDEGLSKLLSSGTGPRLLTIGDKDGKNRREVFIMPITL